MYGTHARRRETRMSRVSRHLLDGGKSTFVAVVPRDVSITDILLYRPYQRGSSATVVFYDIETVEIGRATGVRTNVIHEVFVVASGAVTIQVSTDVAEIVIFYR